MLGLKLGTGLALVGLLAVWDAGGATAPAPIQPGNEWKIRQEEGENALRDGRAKEAVELLTAALKEAEKYGAKDLAVAAVCCSLGLAYNALDELDLAERQYERALGIYEASLNPSHPFLASVLANLSSVFQNRAMKAADKRQRAEAEALAEKLLERALAILEKNFQEGHPSLAPVLNNLAWLYFRQEKPAEAEEALQRSFKLLEKCRLPDQELLPTLGSLAELYSLQRKYGEALPYAKRIAGIWAAAGPGERRQYAASLARLADLFSLSGQAQAAEEHYLRALREWELVLAQEHPPMVMTLLGLAELSRQKKDWGAAEGYFQRGTAALKTILPPEHPQWLIVLKSNAEVLRELGRPAEAEELEVRIKALTARKEAGEEPKR